MPFRATWPGEMPSFGQVAEDEKEGESLGQRFYWGFCGEKKRQVRVKCSGLNNLWKLWATGVVCGWWFLAQR